jgi:6-phosphogluconolactonase
MKHPAQSCKSVFAATFFLLAMMGIAGQAYGAPQGQFLYAIKADSSTPSPVSGYAIDAVTGAISPVPGSPFVAGVDPLSVTVTPSNKFVYVLNGGPASISAYTADVTTGALTPVSGSPFSIGGSDAAPESLVIDPSGKFLYVADMGDNSVSAYTINGATGVLSPVSGSPFATVARLYGPGGEPWSEAIDPSGKFLYVSTVSGYVVAYTIDFNTGALAMVTGSPFSAGPDPTLTSDLRSVAVDPSGNFVYVVNVGHRNVAAYALDHTTGALTQTSGSPITGPAYPYSLTIDPLGKFVYVAEPNPHEGDIWGYTMDSTTGALTLIAGSPFASPVGPFAVAIDPSGKFAYAANEGSTDGGYVNAFAINGSSGALSPLPGSPFDIGSEPWALATTHAPSAEPFATFQANVQIDEDRKTSFRVEGFFTLPATSDPIDPVSDTVQLQVGTFTATIPAGAFKEKGKRTFKFEGSINDVDLKITIDHIRTEDRKEHDKRKDKAEGNDYLFTAEGKGDFPTKFVNPVTVGLTIGEYVGSVTVKAEIEK